jgi:hypothetical protein
MAIMNKSITSISRLLTRTAVILSCLAAPVLAVPVVKSAPSHTIEAPTMKKSGAGLVLLVSLQRG